MPYPLSPFGESFDTKIFWKISDDHNDHSTVNLTTMQNEVHLQILKWLCVTPALTSYRVNTLTSNMKTVQTCITQHLNKIAYKSIEVYEHPHVKDVIIVKHPCRSFNSPELEIYEKEVVVDVTCGAAILRGAHIYAPGVLAMLSGTQKGDYVSIYADLAKKCRKGLQKPYTLERVFLGNGRVILTRNDLFCENPLTKGVAVEVIDTISNCPPLGDDFLPRGSALLQNLPSIICVQVLNPKPGDRILDMCASPGHKTTHIAALMCNKGKIIAIDKTPAKVAQLKENCRIYGTSIVEPFHYDSTKLISQTEKTIQLGEFDKILLDAPCSALGKRPQLLNTTSLKVLRSYVPLQRKLFTNAVALLKMGGVLVYSTCTVTLAENEGIVSWALKTFSHLHLVDSDPHLGGPGFETPGMSHSDLSKLQRFGPGEEIDSVGFFLAKFIKCS